MVDFLSTNTVTVIVGIDGSAPPREIREDLRELILEEVGVAFDMDADRVVLNVIKNTTKSQRDVIGKRALYAYQVDVNIGDRDEAKFMNMVHNSVVNVIDDVGFNITGTATVIDDTMFK